MVDILIIVHFCPNESPGTAYCTSTPGPSLSWHRPECGGKADPQQPHKELWTIKKVDSFYTDLPLCSVWGLILAAWELSRCQGDRCDVLASSRAAAEPLSHRQAGTAEPGNRWEPLGSPWLWRMKNQKKPYWTQIQRESPAPFLSSLVPFLPFLRKHQWMWKAVFPLEAFECTGTPDAILCKWFPHFPAWGDVLKPICISICCLWWDGKQTRRWKYFPDYYFLQFTLVRWKCNPKEGIAVSANF